MTQLTTLTPAAVRAVLLGLSDHSSGTVADAARAAAVVAMADALTAAPPAHDDERYAREHDELLRAHGATQARAAVLRDQLTELLDLDPWASDQDITEAATARAAQRALHRSAEKTAALVTPASGMARQLADAMLVSHFPAGGWPDLLDAARAAVQAQDRMPGQLAEALGVPMPSACWPELLDVARALAEDEAKRLRQLADALGGGTPEKGWDGLIREVEALIEERALGRPR